jgi:hypothetical protein
MVGRVNPCAPFDKKGMQRTAAYLRDPVAPGKEIDAVVQQVPEK